MDSQYEILPLMGITTTTPGSSEGADGVTSEPRGRGSAACFEGYGRAKVKVSGDDVVEVYGQTRAWV
jgi:hypothetical protein